MFERKHRINNMLHDVHAILFNVNVLPLTRGSPQI